MSPEHTIHTGPLIRRESVYKNDLREQRKALFNALYHFTRLLDIQYICPVINQGDCAEKSKLAYTDKLTKEIANQLRAKDTYLFGEKDGIGFGIMQWTDSERKGRFVEIAEAFKSGV